MKRLQFKRALFFKSKLFSVYQHILGWYVPQNISKSLFKDGEERSIASDCTYEEKIKLLWQSATAFGGFIW